MPFRAFKCGAPPCEFTGVGKEAQEHFSRAHRAEGYCLPPAMVKFIEEGYRNEARQGEALSPSMAGGCMREVALARSFPFDAEPLAGFSAFQGSMFHAGMVKVCPEGWLCEVAIPGDHWFDSASNRIEKVELWPGILVSGTADLVNEDFSELEDYKTSREYSKWDRSLGRKVYTHYLPHDGMIYQLNVYGRMVEKLTGKMPELGIWKVLLGCGEPREAIRFYPIEVLELDELKQKVVDGPGGWQRLLEVMREEDLDKRLEMIKEMPLTGRTQLNGTKCEKYCGQKKPCDNLLPPEERW